MRTKRILVGIAMGTIWSCTTVPRPTLQYPRSPKQTVADVYHGTVVADPYRWLEQLDSPQTQEWVTAQNKLTRGFLEAIPGRSTIFSRLQTLWNYEKFSTPFSRAGHFFYFYNPGLQPQSTLYVTEDLKVPGRVLLDPNTWSSDGTVALSGFSVSHDGQLLAYSLSEAGSDWQTWRIRRVANGEDLPDTIRWTKFTTAAWLPDASGFFYGRFEAPEPGKERVATNLNQKLFFHRLGTSQEADLLVYERPDEPTWEFFPTVTDDGRYLVITVHVGTDRRNRVYLVDLATTPWQAQPLLDTFDASYEFVDNEGEELFFLTDRDAAKKKLIAVRVSQPQPAHWRVVISEGHDTIQDVHRVGNTFLVRRLKDAVTSVEAYSLDGTPSGSVALPGLGTAAGFHGTRSDQETFYSFTSFLNPGTVYRLRLNSLISEPIFTPHLATDTSRYITQQVFVPSKDGTRVPLFITHREDLALDGQNPTLLYGYGGFNIALTPSFSPRTLAWLEMGGVYAVACLRGGSEYGEAWHQAGMLQNKQNVFDDFLACARWLIAQAYTSPSKLAIHGASNGGLLVGAAMTKEPQLFAAAIPAVGVMDMLRFHKFTIGWAWASEYGTADDPKMFPVLYRYSPLHNLRDGTCYPATLITTADHDDRVVPSHSYKFAARLQEAQGCNHPVLIRIETRAGHGAGKPITKQIEEAADMLAFLVRALGMQLKLENASN